MITTTCKNCGTAFNGNFCPNCGQTVNTHKLNHNFIWHDIQHGLFHYDKGILFTTKALFTRPGHFIREYIEGKRVNHFKPISLIIILATIYGILAHRFDIKLVSKLSSESGITLEEINEWVCIHFSWIVLFTVPIRALTTLIIFRKQGFNYYEHIVLAAYLASQRLIISLAVVPIDIILNNTNALEIFMRYYPLIEIAFSIWGHAQFFNKLSKPKAILLSIVSWLLFIAILMICLIITFEIINIKY